MRDLFYKVSDVKGFEEIVKTFAEAEGAKAKGFKVEAVVKEVPREFPKMSAKREARRVKAVKA